jgi:hypothetical protein
VSALLYVSICVCACLHICACVHISGCVQKGVTGAATATRGATGCCYCYCCCFCYCALTPIHIIMLLLLLLLLLLLQTHERTYSVVCVVGLERGASEPSEQGLLAPASAPTSAPITRIPIRPVLHPCPHTGDRRDEAPTGFSGQPPPLRGPHRRGASPHRAVAQGASHRLGLGLGVVIGAHKHIR